MKLAYALPDGGVAIVSAAPREVLEPLIGTPNADGSRTLSPEAYLAHVLERNNLRPGDVVRLPKDWAPPNGPRAAWMINKGQIGIDPVKAATAYKALYAVAIDRHIERTARARGYASGDSLSGYVNSSVAVWAEEARTFVAWRDAVWVQALQDMDKVTQGHRTMPNTAALIAELPKIGWP